MQTQTKQNQQLESGQPLGANFFIDLLNAQQNYANYKSKEHMGILLGYYTDCINYFQSKQEQVSLYFQAKIKEIMKDIKIFGTPGRAEIYKDDMAKKIMKEIQQQNIQSQIKQTLQKHQRQLQQISNNIRSQQLNLQERIKKSKRKMNRTLTGTLSMQSIFSTPDNHSADPENSKTKQKRTETSRILFERQINSEDQSGQEYILKVNVFQ